MSLLKDALLKAHKSNPNKRENIETPKRGSKKVMVDPVENRDLHEIHPDEPTQVEEPKKEISTTADIDFGHTRFQIETMSNAEKDKIYIAKDGGVYVGGEDGHAILKASLSPIFVSERRFDKLTEKQPNTLYVIQCIDKLMHVYYKLFCNGITIFSSDSYSNQDIDKLLLKKQDKLESGRNIKTINNQSIVGEGNITIPTIKSEDVNAIVKIEESDYEELENPDPNTLYLVIPDSN